MESSTAALAAALALALGAACKGAPPADAAADPAPAADAAPVPAPAPEVLPAPARPPAAEPQAGGRPVSWWAERLTALRRDGPAELYELTRQRAGANGLRVEEQGGAIRVTAPDDGGGR